MNQCKVKRSSGEQCTLPHGHSGVHDSRPEAPELYQRGLLNNKMPKWFK